jgi:hypothetical protein
MVVPSPFRRDQHLGGQLAQYRPVDPRVSEPLTLGQRPSGRIRHGDPHFDPLTAGSGGER